MEKIIIQLVDDDGNPMLDNDGQPVGDVVLGPEESKLFFEASELSGRPVEEIITSIIATRVAAGEPPFLSGDEEE